MLLSDVNIHVWPGSAYFCTQYLFMHIIATLHVMIYLS